MDKAVCTNSLATNPEIGGHSKKGHLSKTQAEEHKGGTFLHLICYRQGLDQRRGVFSIYFIGNADDSEGNWMPGCKQ